jgi:hypothetical protein
MSTTGVHLDETNATLNEAASEQALPSEVSRSRFIESIKIMDLLSLTCHIKCFWRGVLHPIGKLVGTHAGIEVRILRELCQMSRVFALDMVDEAALQRP